MPLCRAIDKFRTRLKIINLIGILEFGHEYRLFFLILHSQLWGKAHFTSLCGTVSSLLAQGHVRRIFFLQLKYNERTYFHVIAKRCCNALILSGY